MKSTKKLIAILFAAATLFTLFITSASALEIGDTVTWEFVNQPDYDRTEEIPFKGTLTEGWQDIEDTNEEYNTCYEFTAEKDGYYSLSFPSNELTASFAGTYDDGKATNYAEQIFTTCYDDGGDLCFRRIAYLKKGTTLINVKFNEENPAGTSIGINYIAQEIAGISYDEKEVEFLLRDYDEVYVNEDEKFIGLDIEYSIFFSNPSSYILGLNWLECTYEGELKAGENTLTVTNIPGFEQEITAGIYNVVDIVESVELENAENYLDATELYDGTYEYDAYTNEKVTVNFKDGTSETITYIDGEENLVTFPCGKEYYLYVGHTVDERADIGTGKLILCVNFGWSDYYAATDCDVTEASFAQNSEALKNNINTLSEKLTNHWHYYITNIFEDGNFFYWIERGFGDTGLYTSFIFSEISEFVEYCF